MIINPNTGESVVYDTAFDVINSRGLVFFNRHSDPFGAVMQGWD